MIYYLCVFVCVCVCVCVSMCANVMCAHFHAGHLSRKKVLFFLPKLLWTNKKKNSCVKLPVIMKRRMSMRLVKMVLRKISGSLTVIWPQSINFILIQTMFPIFMVILVPTKWTKMFSQKRFLKGEVALSCRNKRMLSIQEKELWLFDTIRTIWTSYY